MHGDSGDVGERLMRGVRQAALENARESRRPPHEDVVVDRSPALLFAER
jgi:hypothetical protein